MRMGNHPHFFFTDYIYKTLETALDYGISELDFWTMTLAEVIRAIESKRRIREIEAQDRATFDWILGDLIGKSVARIYDSANTYPKIYEAYPSIFDAEKIQEAEHEQLMEMSAARFKAFASSFNENFDGRDNEN